MTEDSDTAIDGAASGVALYEDQTLCKQLLEAIDTTLPLQILPSKIPGAGVGLFTTRTIQDEEEIFRSSPLVNFVTNEMHSLVCDHCFIYQRSKVHSSGRFRSAEDIEPDMKACSGCKVCHYCSKVCQKKAWKHYHRHECVLFSEQPTMHPHTRALYRLLNMKKHNLLSLQQWTALEKLQAHVGEYLNTANASVIIGASKGAMYRTGTELDLSSVVTLYCTLFTNSLTVHPAEGGILRMSLDIVSSLMNHSCNPNAFVFFEGNSLRVRPMRKLLAGEEITQGYTDLDVNVLIRRTRLKSEYFFDCQCNRCEEQMRAHENQLPDKRDKIEQSQQQLIKLVDEAVHPIDVDKIEAQIQVIAKHAFPGGDGPDDLEPLPKLHIRLAARLKEQNRYIDALKQSLRGCLSLEQRSGHTWFRNLFDLLQILALVLMLPPKDYAVMDHGVPQWDVLHGYLHELIRAAIKVFGSDVGYTKAIQSWYQDCFSSDDQPKPGTRAFAVRFKKAQSKMLRWAGVDNKKGIVLTK